MGPGESTTVTIVQEISDRDGVRPTDLEPPLYEVVDTEALDALFRSSGDDTDTATVRLEFTYRGYTVSVTGPQEVEIEPTRRSAESSSD
ncbi:HalOD1 output domain-containing protein [Natrarchaeobius chitinivorans]|uniref:Halobacterial output domain-containing protein n=1 Tax=Natrarchaeobius chitinivorans TaxID=1679083 RepID=A0A3N6MPC8_NATCH|nr:HalOD1 output domain-containing protein [Natrarchaeobius chitinivorans]RQG98011.1 hypothetical protein EA473_02140 [Natrarchaeobius chitinivorans]